MTTWSVVRLAREIRKYAFMNQVVNESLIFRKCTNQYQSLLSSSSSSAAADDVGDVGGFASGEGGGKDVASFPLPVPRYDGSQTPK